MVWKGLQISFRCDTRRIYDWNETTPKRGLIREKNKMRRNSGDQIFIKIVGFSSFYDRFIIDIASFELRMTRGKKIRSIQMSSTSCQDFIMVMKYSVAITKNRLGFNQETIFPCEEGRNGNRKREREMDRCKRVNR